MRKPWYQSLTKVGGVLIGAAQVAKPLLPHSVQTTADAVVDAAPAIVQGVGLMLSMFGIRNAIAANGSGK